MLSGIPALGSPLDPLYRPVTRVLREHLGLMPSHITWASLVPRVSALGISLPSSLPLLGAQSRQQRVSAALRPLGCAAA